MTDVEVKVEAPKGNEEAVSIPALAKACEKARGKLLKATGKVERVKKPRTEKQIKAFEKARETLLKNRLAKKKATEAH